MNLRLFLFIALFFNAASAHAETAVDETDLENAIQEMADANMELKGFLDTAPSCGHENLAVSPMPAGSKQLKFLTITSDCVLRPDGTPEEFYLDLTFSDSNATKISGITFYGTNMREYNAETKKTEPIYPHYSVSDLADEVCLVKIKKLGITYNAACVETGYSFEYTKAGGSTETIKRTFDPYKGGFVKLDYLYNGKEISIGHAKGSRKEGELYITKENGKWVTKWVRYDQKSDKFIYTEINHLKMVGNGYGDDCVGTKSISPTKK